MSIGCVNNLQGFFVEMFPNCRYCNVKLLFFKLENFRWSLLLNKQNKMYISVADIRHKNSIYKYQWCIEISNYKLFTHEEVKNN